MAELPSRFQTGTNFEQAIPLLNDLLNELDGEKRTKIISNQGVPQLIFGYQKAGFNGQDYGLKISRINPGTGLPYNVTTATDEQLAFVAPTDTQLYYNDGVPQVLFGRDNGGFNGLDFGVKASKIDPGTGKPYDVRTATDDQLTFSTGFDQLRVRASDTLTITLPGSGTGVYGTHTTIAHGLGYTPAVLAYVKLNFDTELIGEFWVPATLIGGLLDEFYVAVDDTNLKFVAIVNDISDWYDFAVQFRYYILQETAT